MQKQSPMLRLWQLGARHHSGLVRAIVSASLGVLGGMLPYFGAAQIIIGLLSGRTGYGFYAAWCLVALAGFCLRALLYALALSMSHKATFPSSRRSVSASCKSCRRCPLARSWTRRAAR